MDPSELGAWEESLMSEAEMLRAEIQRLSAELATVEERLSLVGRLRELDRDTGEQPLGDQFVHAAPTVTDRSLEDVVVDILEKSGEPMHISVIREALIDGNFPIPGRGDDANIIVRLRQDQDRFTRTARGTYALAKWGLPELKSKQRRSAKKKVS